MLLAGVAHPLQHLAARLVAETEVEHQQVAPGGGEQDGCGLRVGESGAAEQPVAEQGHAPRSCRARGRGRGGAGGRRDGARCRIRRGAGARARCSQGPAGEHACAECDDQRDEGAEPAHRRSSRSHPRQSLRRR